MKLIFLGPPGAGKGTQAERIAERYGLAHISTGDMLRAEMREGTALGEAARGYISRGELVPDEVIIGMVKGRILQSDCANGFLFDGFPRTVAQADALSGICAIDRVINIDVPFDRLVARISGRRMCPDCGAELKLDAKFCTVCGKDLTSAGETDEAEDVDEAQPEEEPVIEIRLPEEPSEEETAED